MSYNRTRLRICWQGGAPLIDAREIGSMIRSRRALLGLTQAQVAEAAGVSKRTLWSMELGQSPNVQLDKLAAVLDVLGLDLDVIQSAEESAGSEQAAPQGGSALLAFMPLINTAFAPGSCKDVIAGMAEGPTRDIAMAEYHYFSGQSEKGMRESEPYLVAPDVGIRLSACWIYSYACLTMGQIGHSRKTLQEIRDTLSNGDETDPTTRTLAAFTATAAAVLLHLPLPNDTPPIENFAPLLPTGLRAFALYVQAHHLYLNGDYDRSAGIAEAALAMGAASYPIPAIYLHLVAVMDFMSLRREDLATSHLLAAWEIARPDGLIEGFGEHHGLLGGMLEAVIKPRWPEEFKEIINITYRFSSGWRKVHNPMTGHDVADDLTTTEFAVAMLAARGWTNQEIATHMGISVNTAKGHISSAMRKLQVASRKDLKRYMLR